MSPVIVQIILLLWVRFVPSSPLSAGGNSSLDIFYCEPAGCAANVSKVFCDDDHILKNKHIEDCKGLPSLHSVCQHDGRAFVSAPKEAKCDFESKNNYIRTIKCTDADSICLTLTLITSTTSSPAASDVEQRPEWTTDKMIYIILAVICGIVLLGGVALKLYCHRRRQTHGARPASIKLHQIFKPLEA